MARYTGPKFRLDRREGVNLFLKGTRSLSTKHPLEKKGAVPPGQQGQRSLSKKQSEYGTQLREKQKIKRIYGVLEKQFKRYLALSQKTKGATGVTLLRILETRLDNVVYRLGFAYSRNQARQTVNHGHVRVDDKKVNIPSFSLKPGEVVSLNPKMSGLTGAKDKENKLPEWLEKKGLSGRMVRYPTREELDPTINEQLVVEFYSR